MSYIDDIVEYACGHLLPILFACTCNTICSNMQFWKTVQNLICPSVDIVIFMKVIYGKIAYVEAILFHFTKFIHCRKPKVSPISISLLTILWPISLINQYSQSTNDEAKRFSTWRYE